MKNPFHLHHPKAPTVKVRVAVAVDYRGNWNATGWNQAPDDNAMDNARQGLGKCAAYWIEVDLPLPDETVSVAHAHVVPA